MSHAETSAGVAAFPKPYLAPSSPRHEPPTTRASTSPATVPRTVQPSNPNTRSEEHTSELQSRLHLVCRLLLEKKKKNRKDIKNHNALYTKSRMSQTHRDQ